MKTGLISLNSLIKTVSLQFRYFNFVLPHPVITYSLVMHYKVVLPFLEMLDWVMYGFREQDYLVTLSATGFRI